MLTVCTKLCRGSFIFEMCSSNPATDRLSAKPWQRSMSPWAKASRPDIQAVSYGTNPGDAKDRRQPHAHVKRQRPNYFVAIPIRNPVIHRGLQQIQDHIVKQKEGLKAAVVSVKTAHLTVLVCRLADDEELSRAKEALDSCLEKRPLQKTTALQMTVSGLGNFKNTVLFAKVVGQEVLDELHEIADAVVQCFVEKGLISEEQGAEDFKPHITLMKLSKVPDLRAIGVKKIHAQLYEDFLEQELGQESVYSLQLCSMNKMHQDSGYYHVDHTIQIAPGDPDINPVADGSSELVDDASPPGSKVEATALSGGPSAATTMAPEEGSKDFDGCSPCKKNAVEENDGSCSNVN